VSQVRPVKVLLVDPIADDWELQAEVLRRAGYRVLEPGANALRVAVDEQPDIILVDTTPRRLGASEFVATVKGDQRTATIPVIVMSSLPRADAMVAGAEGFVGKPHTPAAILAELHRVLIERPND
jgi:CheY-like chemotaxis protein